MFQEKARVLWEHDVAGSEAARRYEKTTECCFPLSVTEPQRESNPVIRLKRYFRDVAQLVARVLWEHDVAGSNPVIPTKKEKTPLRLFSLFLFGVSIRFC